jgi:hypothetical protein
MNTVRAGVRFRVDAGAFWKILLHASPVRALRPSDIRWPQWLHFELKAAGAWSCGMMCCWDVRILGTSCRRSGFFGWSLGLIIVLINNNERRVEKLIVRSVRQISSLLLTPKNHYRVHKCSQLPISWTIWINPHPNTHFSDIHFNINLQSTPSSSNPYAAFSSATKTLRVCSLFHACYIPRSSHLPDSIILITLGEEYQAAGLCIITFCSADCHFIPLRWE